MKSFGLQRMGAALALAFLFTFPAVAQESRASLVGDDNASIANCPPGAPRCLTPSRVNGFLQRLIASVGTLLDANEWAQAQKFDANPIFVGCAGYLLGNGASPASCALKIPAGGLPLGVSVVDPGDGTLEAVLPVQSVAGATYGFASGDLFKKTRRSNAGVAMADTLLAATVLDMVNGARVDVANVDATAADALTAGAGTAIAAGCANVPPGRDVMLVYDLPNATWRGDGNSCTALLSVPAPTSSSLGGVESDSSVAHNWIAWIDSSGIPHQSQPAFSDISGSVAPSQLPAPTSSSLGGVESDSSVAHNWIAWIDSSGVPHQSQPALGDISGFGAGVPTALAQPANGANGVPVETNAPAADEDFIDDAWTAIPNCASAITYSTSTHLWGCNAGLGTGNVSNSGTPAAGQLPLWVSATAIDGVTLGANVLSALETAENGTGAFAGTNSPAFTGAPSAPTQSTADNSTDLATDQYVHNVVNALPAAAPAPWSITGCLPLAMSGANNTAAISIGACTAADQSDTATIGWTASKSWAVANGNAPNGYAGGATLPNSSTIHVYDCHGASGDTSYGSTTAPGTFEPSNCPSGYTTNARRIFSFVTTSAGAPQAFVADEVAGGGYIAYLASAVFDLNGVTPPSANRTLYTLSVPTGIKAEWNGRYYAHYNSAAETFLVTSPDEADVAAGTYNIAPGQDVNASSGAPINSLQPGGPRRILTNTAGQLGVRSGAANGMFYLDTTAFGDARRS
jgi:hypothetical protein